MIMQFNYKLIKNYMDHMYDGYICIPEYHQILNNLRISFYDLKSEHKTTHFVSIPIKNIIEFDEIKKRKDKIKKLLKNENIHI